MERDLFLAAVLEGNAEDCGTQVWVDGRFIPIAPLGKHLLRSVDDSIMSGPFLRCGDTLGHQRGRPWRTCTAQLKSKIYKKLGVRGLGEGYRFEASTDMAFVRGEFPSEGFSFRASQVPRKCDQSISNVLRLKHPRVPQRAKTIINLIPHTNINSQTNKTHRTKKRERN